MEDYHYLFKYIMIGNTMVGKTCILNRYIENVFNQHNNPTIGVEFGSSKINTKNGKTIRLQI